MFARGGAIQEAEDALKPFRGRVSIVARVRFGLLTVGTPNVIVAIAGPDAPPPIDSKMTPVYGGDTIVGGDFESIFGAASIGQTKRIVTVLANGAELARTTVDFAALE
jgi:hypothetical protein